MLIDKAIYKRFEKDYTLAGIHRGTPFEVTSNTVSLPGFTEDKTKVYEFIPKIKGTLEIVCYFNYRSGSPGATGNFYIYVDDILQTTLSVYSVGGNFRNDDAVITFNPFSKIKILAKVREESQMEDYNVSKEAYVTLSGTIVDDVEQYIIEVNE